MSEDGIPGVFIDWKEAYKAPYIKYQIDYPDMDNPICTIVQGFNTAGNQSDYLEICGLLKPKELTIENADDLPHLITKDEVGWMDIKGSDSVGYLTSKEVFERIKWHHKRHRQRY